MSIRVGIIGYGGIARAHMQSVQLSEGAGELVGGMDVSAERRAAFEEDAKAPAFEDYRALLDRAKPDAVVLCTPPAFREDIVAECVERGLAILCEKPLAHTAASARVLEQTVSGSKKVCAVAYCWRFNHAIERMRQLIAAGDLGEPMVMHNVFAGDAGQHRETWRTDVAISGGGCLADNGSHSLDLFRYLCGPVESVCGATRHAWGKDRGDDTGYLLARARSGAVAHVTVSWTYPIGVGLVEVVGSKGVATLDFDVIQDLVIRRGTERQVEKMPEERRFVDQMKAFLAAAAGGDRGRLATFTEGREAVEWIEQASCGKG